MPKLVRCLVKSEGSLPNLCPFQFLKVALSRQFCENLLAHPRRKLIHEGPLELVGKRLQFSNTSEPTEMLCREWPNRGLLRVSLQRHVRAVENEEVCHQTSRGK